MATRLLRNTLKLSLPLVMKPKGGGGGGAGGVKNQTPPKRHAPFMRDGVLIDVDSLTGRLLVHPDDDLAFVASVIKKKAIFFWFTKESEEDFNQTHLKGSTNLVSARALGQTRFVYFFGKDPTTLGVDADLKQSYDKMIMVLPESQEMVKKLFCAVSPMLKDNGVIKVFHVEAWDIKKQAEDCSLECLVVENFDSEKYPDFAPRRGGSEEKVDLTSCVVYSFRVKKEKEEALSEKKGGKGNEKAGKGNEKKAGKGNEKKGGKGNKKEGLLQVLVDSDNVSKMDPRGRIYHGYPGRNVGDGNMGTGMLPVPYDMGGMLPRDDAAAAMQQPMPITALDSAFANAPPEQHMMVSKEVRKVDLLDTEKVKDEFVSRSSALINQEFHMKN